MGWEKSGFLWILGTGKVKIGNWERKNRELGKKMGTVNIGNKEGKKLGMENRELGRKYGYGKNRE